MRCASEMRINLRICALTIYRYLVVRTFQGTLGQTYTHRHSPRKACVAVGGAL